MTYDLHNMLILLFHLHLLSEAARVRGSDTPSEEELMVLTSSCTLTFGEELCRLCIYFLIENVGCYAVRSSLEKSVRLSPPSV